MIALLFALLLGFFCPAAAQAHVSIRELSSATSPRWEARYETGGLSVEIDVAIAIPEAERAPVLRVRRMPPLEESLRAELESLYAQASEEDRVNRYAFRSDAFSTIVTHALPPSWGEDRNAEFVVGAMSENLFDLHAFDPDKAYADGSALTVAEAVDILKAQAAALFPEEAFQLRTVYVEGQTFWKRTGKPIRERGGYSLCLSQVFRGIPFMASVHEAFTELTVGSEDFWLAKRGVVRGSVFDAEAWSIGCALYREAGVLCEDIPLLPFDAVKDKIEALILSGHVRWIDSVTLGYAEFDSADPGEQILMPCWVVWCAYEPCGAGFQRGEAVNGSAELLYDGNNDIYRPLIFNAQTGELIDPENAEEGRCLFPGAMRWEELR